MADTSVSPDAAAVRARGLVKSFGARDLAVRVIDAVDLDVAAGAITFVTGPSGCGKTTLVSMLAALLTPDVGCVEVMGTRIDTLTPNAAAGWRARNVGFVFQQFHLLPALDATDNAAVPLLIRGVPRREARRRAASLLERLGMEACGARLPSQLSGGQQQRVAIARALVNAPSLLICDEPTASLDARTGQVTMELLQEVAAHPHRAVVVVTHDHRIDRFADRVIEMSDGRVVAMRQGVRGEVPA